MTAAASPASSPSTAAGQRFAVVIVNYNGGAMLRACVQSALAEAVPPPRIIVVDNGSQDNSLTDLEQTAPAVTLLRNSCNAGFARAVNQGIRHAQGGHGVAQHPAPDFVLLLNNDAQLDPGALAAFARGFDSQPTLAIAGGQLRFPDGRLQSAFAPLPSLAEEVLPRFLLRLIAPGRFNRKTLTNQPLPVQCVLGACIAVRTAALPQLGLLDEDFFFYFEEIDWCRRARQSGLEVIYLPNARGQTADRFRGPARVEYQRSKLIYFRKPCSTPAYLLLATVMVLRTCINALFSGIVCVATLFMSRRMRWRAHTYWYLVAWHLQLRPASWGLPDRCPDDRE
jgi:N-acetylglucosaminyl-diphospho-decaprenol L-rhamnosyltransferase